MRFTTLSWITVLAAFATASPATAPVAAISGSVRSEAVMSIQAVGPLDAAREPGLAKRISADFGLDHQWQNELLFGGNWADVGAGSAKSQSLSVTCVECWTNGTITADLTTEDIVKPIVRLAFDGVEAYLDLNIQTSDSATYSITLFSTDSPLPLSLPGLDIGLIFSIDLVFSVSASVDMEGGFYLKLANDAYLDTSIFDGEIVDSLFDGIQTRSIPVTMRAGNAAFTADLRLRVQCGAQADLDIFGIGAGAMVGIYANLLQIEAELDSTSTCALQTCESFDLNVGAYARLDVEVDYKSFGAVPSVSTTLYESPTLTQCWDDSGAAATDSSTAHEVTAAASSMASSFASQAVSAAAAPNSQHDTKTSPKLVVMATPGGTQAASSKTAQVVDAPSRTSRHYPTIVSSGRSLPLMNTSAAAQAPETAATSTTYITNTYTVTSCSASVVNCPASMAKEVVATQTRHALYSTLSPSALGGASSARALMVTIPKVSPKVETFSAASTAESFQDTVTAAAAAYAMIPSAGAKAQEKEVAKGISYQNSTLATAPNLATGLMAVPTVAPSAPLKASGHPVEVRMLRARIAATVLLASLGALAW